MSDKNSEFTKQVLSQKFYAEVNFSSLDRNGALFYCRKSSSPTSAPYVILRIIIAGYQSNSKVVTDFSHAITHKLNFGGSLTPNTK
jgi:hypothetical protein